MTETFNRRFGFLSGSDDADQQSRKIEKVTKTLEKLDKSFSKTIDNLTKVLKKTTNEDLKKMINDLLATAKTQDAVRDRLRKSGQIISKGEADSFIKASKSLSDTLSTNKELSEALKNAGRGTLAELDVGKELKKTSKEIGENASRFIASNIKQISQSGFAGEAGNTALKAISPEAAFFTEALGINLQEKLNSGIETFSEDSQDLEDVSNGVQDVVEATQETNDKLDDIQDTLVEANQNDQIKEQLGFDFGEAQTTATEDQTEALIEALTKQSEEIGNVEEAIDRNGKGLFSRFFSRGSFLGKVLSPLSGVLRFLAPLGKLLKLGLKGGAIGLGALTGFDTLKDIFSNGLDTGKALKAIGGGALAGAGIGSFFGPVGTLIGGLIGGGVGGLAAIIADNIDEEDLKRLKDGFENIGNFISTTFNKALEYLKPAFKSMAGFMVDAVEFLKNFIEDPVGKLDQAFDYAGEKLNEFLIAGFDKFDKLKSWISDQIDNISMFIGDSLDSIANFFTDTFETIKNTLMDVVNTPIDFINNFFSNKDQLDVIDQIKAAQKSRLDKAKSLSGLSVPMQEALASNLGPEIVSMETGANILESSDGIEHDISQIKVARSIKESSEDQNKMQEKQQQLILQQSKEKSSKYKSSGSRTLDNSPIMTNDLGLMMTIGGGN